jgi:hypothetical protein
MSIMPDVANGGIVIRSLSGVCSNLGEAPNAYCPPASFAATCQLTALAEDCSARVMPSQINAIVSELMCLAVALDPDGPWDCNSNCNLGTMFTAWAEQFEDGTTVTTDGTTVDGDGSPGNPIRLDVAGAVAAICGHETAAEALVACLISADAGNVIGAGSDGRLFAAGTVVTETPITGNGSEANPVGLDIPATISEDGINLVTTGTDGKLLVTVAVAGVLTGTGTLADPIRLDTTPTGTVQQICGDDEAHDALAACLISNDPLNILVQGLDGGLLVPASSSSQPEGDGESITVDSPFSVIPDGLVATICGSETAREALSLCLLSSDTDNGIQVVLTRGYFRWTNDSLRNCL